MSLLSPLRRSLSRVSDGVARRAVSHGLPPSWLGYRWVAQETLRAYFARHGGPSGPHGRLEVVQPEAIARHPLPRNVSRRDELPDDAGWWGYAFRDVPERPSDETLLATLPDCRIVSYRDPAKADDFYPAILTRDGRALDLREVRFRPLHAAYLRDAHVPASMPRAAWFVERVYHNHSHWLTAHLPKLLLLRERGLLGDLLLPAERTPAIDGSLRLLGLDPEAFPSYDRTRPLDVGQLTLLSTDRFRPELLRLVPAAFGTLSCPPPTRRVFISRAKAARRRLLNEDEVWSRLVPLGFERVVMEELSFAQQVRLMQETAVLLAPHGAGLTNMIFCPPGVHVVEIADLSFPNPNFYAMAAALDHAYWIVNATSHGAVPRLEQDLRCVLEDLDAVLPALAGAATLRSAGPR